jgi:sarcosine oxidase subunit alpha
MDDLRIVSIKRGPKITIFVNGHRCSAYLGESVQAALFAAGYRTLRKTPKNHQARGVFCGMGVCYDCLVTINGMPNQRACMTLVQDRMEIRIDE